MSLQLQAIAQFTYEQCYNYYNWDGVVRLPAVLQYAHKLSKLTGEHVREHVNFVDYQQMVKR